MAKTSNEPISKVNRIFRFATTNPPEREYDAELLDELVVLWEQVLTEHYLFSQFQLTAEQKHNLITAWRFDY
jgi:hypothetical protein